GARWMSFSRSSWICSAQMQPVFKRGGAADEAAQQTVIGGIRILDAVRGETRIQRNASNHPSDRDGRRACVARWLAQSRVRTFVRRSESIVSRRIGLRHIAWM